ncbi:glycerate kinase [Streptomyces sp. NBC_00448]|uniref:glycerate kinase n=1 Tax=Streptomyces sp. NBC_00448 TaxID=2903652 RepID=UPI002E1C556A
MRVVMAPGSFPPHLTAPEAARELTAGWLSVRPRDVVVPRPLPDGGEGTPAAVAAAAPDARVRRVPGCTGPDHRTAVGAYLAFPDGTVLIELGRLGAAAGQLHGAALTATSRGAGELLAHALDHGARRLMLAPGERAALDGGAGLLSALGMRLLDTAGCVLPDGGGALARVARIDRSRLLPPPDGGVVVLLDTDRPLLGPAGAAAFDAPRQGGGPAEAADLDRGLARLAALLGGDAERPGAGAAGGAAHALASAWGAVSVRAARGLCELLGLGKELAAADLVLTGSGQEDPEAGYGPLTAEVARLAVTAGTAVTALPGAARQLRRIASGLAARPLP